MLTIRDALQLLEFSRANLVAGEGGCERSIQWVHTVDIPDAQYEWERQGVLLLTSLYGVHQDPKRQTELIPKLVEEGFAGMVHSTVYLDQTPKIIRDQANALNFPIIETPPDLLFIEISEAILLNIVNQQYRLLRQSNRIHDTLTDLVLRGGNLQELADTLATLLGRSITIESPSFRVLASAKIGEVDPARVRSVESGKTSAALVRHLQAEGLFDRIRAQRRPVRVPAVAELGLTLDRFVAPIIANQTFMGYFWIIAGEHGLSSLDELAVRNAATVAALILYNEQTLRQALEERQGDLLGQLINGVSDLHSTLELGRAVGVWLDRPLQVLAVRVKSGLEMLMQESEPWLNEHAPKSLCALHEDQMIVVLSHTTEPPDVDFQAFAHTLNYPGGALSIGVGRLYPSIQEDSLAVQKSYAEANEAANIGRAAGQLLVEFETLDLLHWLYHIPQSQIAGNRYWQVIVDLRRHDLDNDTDLLRSLKGYLESGGAIAAAAERLYVHRNTLLNRISRIEALTGLDLRAPEERINIQLALKMWDLRG